ncbi:sodium/proline symporter, sodium/pantothenate symporter [Halanaeroarchaeum sulfurireducens]|uniref:Sodium/proline symporter, sodium/pantothenate symporter n=2 Tax=Halanaeroarchaeum sulfurireducens TaxID=1604004 RepID=A0A0F7PAZ3_9EURY|nr:sodium:solute symporter family protein [Halanaeroarchaeum sulfurireducens]AKH98326.1 sodium/proline symporter, sodium/pantothenate symporter [Halanaeroarchaeum sulfurireducens]ALG82720.1 sodium/proline symporter, sodium/pantothenate symporter [Halanaeroarchaeum sulfurireducens]
MGIIVGYLLVALGVGLVAYRVTERTAEDYYLASRTFGTVVLLFTVFATLLSAFTFFGGPDNAYALGPEWILVMGLMDGIIFALLWYVVGYKQWLLGQRNGYITLGEMLGDRFASRRLRGLIAAVSLFWLFPYVMLQQIGAGAAIAGLTGDAVPFWVGASLITTFMIIYVVLAGIRGIAWTDTLQGMFMLSMVWLALAWVLLSVDGGITTINAGLQANAPEFFALGGGAYTPQFMLTFAISIAFGVAMFPQINQRFFAASSETVLKRSFALWPVLVLVLFVPAFLLGTWAAGLGIEANVAAGESVLPIVLAEYTPTWFAALVIAGAIAAMMSSSDSMLLSGSSYFTRDIYRPFVNERLSPRAEDRLGRIGVVVFAVAALLTSIWAEAGGIGAATVGSLLIDIGDLAFSGFAQLTGPVLLALYWRGTTRAGMYAGVLVPQVVYIAFNFLPETLVGGVPLFAESYFGWGLSLYAMLLGLAITIAVSIVTARAPGEKPDLTFDLESE